MYRNFNCKQFFLGGVVAVHTNKTYFEKPENISPNIYIIFYFEALGKAIEEQNPNVLYKVSRWGSHAIGGHSEMLESGILLFTLAAQTLLLMLSHIQIKHIYTLKLCKYNMYNAFMKSMCIPLYKHGKKGKRPIEKW